jgi:hypothetical protein
MGLMVSCLVLGAVSTFEPEPLRFEPNLGQADPSARFIARGSGVAMGLEAGGLRMLFGELAPVDPEAGGPRLKTGRLRLGARVLLRFLGARSDRWPTGVGLGSAVSNYLSGSDPARWVRGVPRYSAVEAPELWPGVKLLLRADGGRVRFDLNLAPGANPAAIGFAFEGAEAPAISADWRTANAMRPLRVKSAAYRATVERMGRTTSPSRRSTGRRPLRPEPECSTPSKRRSMPGSRRPTPARSSRRRRASFFQPVYER